MSETFAGLTGRDFEGFHTGGDTECWRRLGSHVTARTAPDGSIEHGTRFTVWAPNALEVQIRASFNDWDGSQHPMELIPGTGVWGLFVPDVGEGEVYKYHIRGAHGTWQDKVDPMARFAESAPHNGSIVHHSTHEWSDDEWMTARPGKKPWEEPMSIYEVHLGSWRQGRTYSELADELVAYVRDHRFTHVELMGVAEHPLELSWGYQVTNYFAPSSRWGTPDELRLLIDRFHQAGIGVLMDWVPGHFPKDDWALGRFDGTGLYEHEDPRQGEHKEWGTYIFNYGRNEVKSFLVSNALYWVSEFHFDGLRVDAVASMLYLDYSRNEGEWVPNQYGGNHNLAAIDFLRYVNKHLYERVGGIAMIAEESTSFPGVTAPVDHGGLGFGFKWNMGWMNDSLSYIERDPIHRRYHHHDMTFAAMYAFSENFILPISHDEVVHGKGSMINKVPQDHWRKFATLRAFYAWMWAFPGKQLLFMGSEFGQWLEFDEAASLDWALWEMPFHRGLRQQFHDMNDLYRRTPALYEQDNTPKGFEWIDADNADQSVYAWLRYSRDGQVLACVVNFSATGYGDYWLGLPRAGRWRQVLNTDDPSLDGDGLWGNPEQVEAQAIHGERWAAWAGINVPPLGAVWLIHEADNAHE